MCCILLCVLAASMLLEPAVALCAGHVCTLDSLKQNFFEPFVLTAEQKEEMCKVEFGHDQPGGKGGDSVQGL